MRRASGWLRMGAALLLLACGSGSGGGGASGGGGGGGSGGGGLECQDPSGRVPERPAGDYYVRRDGSDDADGKSYATAFASVQRGVSALQPGQTLVIGPGEYFGPVVADHLGSLDEETVIRAERPGTVLLRGDVPAPRFAPLPGFRRVYVADHGSAQELQRINELDTLKVLSRVPTLAELEYSPGRFFHDRAAGKLYLSTTDTLPAAEHAYTLGLVGTHGLYLDTPQRVRVEGLAATGFNSAGRLPYEQWTLWGTYGIFIKNGRRSTISHCQAYLNGRGIGLSNEYGLDGGDNLITHSAAWGNAGAGLGDSTGGIDLLYPRRDEVRSSVAFLNPTTGIAMRGGTSDLGEANASFIRHSLAWGNGRSDFRIKTDSNVNYYEHSVAFGVLDNTSNVRHGITGRGRSTGPDSIQLSTEPGLELEREFADPENFDFRLQARSRFIGAAPDGSDRGAFPYDGAVRYVSPEGSDAGDGRSVDQAYATLAKATEGLAPGDTLYLSPGLHSGELTLELHGTEQAPIVLRGRGSAPAVLSGKLRLTGSQHVWFERVHFAEDVVVEQSEHVRFEASVFLGHGTALTATNTAALRVTQSTFSGFTRAAVSLPCSVDAHLAGNLYDNPRGPALEVFSAQAVGYSDYNSFTQRDGAWWVAPAAGSAQSVQAGHELASQQLTPSFLPSGGSLGLAHPAAFFGGGTLGNIVGAYRRQIPKERLRLLEGPRVHSVSATTANIEWFTSHPAVTSLSWGPTREVEHQATLEAKHFASFSLTGLTPNTTYTLRLDALRIPEAVVIDAEPVTLEPTLLEFRTLAVDAPPRTYHVSPTGSDANTGLSPAEPLRTLQRAADLVNVGDTVLIAGGVYSETVRLRATGSAAAPIRFQGQPGERVELDGAERQLDMGFIVGSKQHLRFDNFFFTNQGQLFSESEEWTLHMSGQFNLFASRDILISRVLSDGRTTPDRLVVAREVDGLHLSNVVDGNKLQGHYLQGCPNLLIEHCVFARPQITAFLLRNTAAEPALIRKNIFTDSLAVKSYQDELGNPTNITLLTVDRSRLGVRLEDNVFFLRYYAPSERHLIGTSTYPELADVMLFGTVFIDPQFQGVADLLAAGGVLGPYAPSLPPFPPDAPWGTRVPFTFRTWLATEPSVLSSGAGLEPHRFDAVSGLPQGAWSP